jgi:hypothetical protein
MKRTAKRPTREDKFWDFVERNHQEVSKWPQWMKGGNPVPEGRRPGGKRA